MPLIVLVLAFLFGLININTVIGGVIGSGSIETWKILIIFFGSALISISADKSGIFDHISVSILNKGRGRGILLFFIVYCQAWFLSIFASNDIVILTLTPIIFYFSRYSNINIIPLLFAEFIGANNGAFFITGNPVDTIIATSLGITQIDYLVHTIIPTLTMTVASFALLWLYFRKSITRRYKVNDISKSVRNWFDAKFSLIMLAVLMVALIMSSYLRIELYLIILSVATLFIAKDLYIPYRYPNQLFEKRRKKRWRLHQTVAGMPWEILPFVLVMFIMMEALAREGVFTSIVVWLLPIAEQSIWHATMLFGFLSLIVENIINNQPMAIMFSHLFADPLFQLHTQTQSAGIYATIISGNGGASLTLVGSLAGLMWYKILKDKGLHISYWRFARVGLAVVLPSIILALLVLAWTL